MEEKIMNEAALDPYRQEWAMDSLHNGGRGSAISAMNSDKLEMNFDICRLKGYNIEAAKFESEGKKRGLSRMTNPDPLDVVARRLPMIKPCQAVQQQIANINAQKQSQQTTSQHANTRQGRSVITFDVSDLDRYAAKIVKQYESDPDALIKLEMAKVGTIKHLILDLTYAIVLHLDKNLKDKLKDFLLVNCELTADELRLELRKILDSSDMCEKLSEIKAHIDESLTEDIEKHDELNPKLWEDNKLKQEVKEKIELIVNEFLDNLKEDEISIDASDIILIGSNCSYNYTKDSDLDIHIIAKHIDAPENLYDKIYSAYRSLFNKKLDIEFYGIPVEIYVEIDGVPHVSNGCYSVMNDEWIKEPVKEDIPEIDKEAFDKEFKVWEDRYNKIVDNSEEKLEEGIRNKDLRTYLEICCGDKEQVFEDIPYKNALAKIISAVKSCKDRDTLSIQWLNGPEGSAGSIIEILDIEDAKNFSGKRIQDSDLIEKEDLEKIKGLLHESLTEDVNTAKSIIADQIRGEWEAISNYDKAVSELENLDGNFQNAIDILNDIADEEEVHVGEEQKVLSELDNNVLNNIKEGEEEVEEKISEPAKDLNYEDENVEESLDEALAVDIIKDVKNIDMFKDLNPKTIYKMLQLYSDDMGVRVKDIDIEEFADWVYTLHDFLFDFAEDIDMNTARSLAWADPELHKFCVDFCKNEIYTDEFSRSIEYRDEDYINFIFDNYQDSPDMPKEKIPTVKEIVDWLRPEFENYMKKNESLTEEVETKQLDEIDKFLEDIYALRQKGLQESGEYGIENLVFKEIRNKGYLDNLKDLKNQLVSKELSLESLEEDTVKNSKGKWVNKGEDGTHGEFKTKKAADAQRKAMFANGYHEELDEWVAQNHQPKVFDYYTPIAKNGYYELSAVMDELYDILNDVFGGYDEDEIKTPKDAINLIFKYSKENNYDFDELLTNFDYEYRAKSYDLDNKNLEYYINGSGCDFDWLLTMFASYYHDKPGIYTVDISNRQTGEFTKGKIEVLPDGTWKDVDLISEALHERLDDRKRRDYHDEISRIAYAHPIIQDNGLFNIYNIKENDVDRIVRRIRNLDYIEWVQKNESGKYDFSKVVMFGQPQPRYYNITGKIKEEI